MSRLPHALLAALACGCWLGLSMPAQAEKVYIYRDAQGEVYFTDHPVAPKNYRLQGVRHYGRPPAWKSCLGLSNKTLKQRAERYTPMIKQVAAQSGVPWKLVRAVIAVESCFDPKAVSVVGAQGLMQLMPDTARRFGVTHPFDPLANLEAGTRYLAGLIRRYQGNLRLALAAYNAGPAAVKRYDGIPPYPETQNFVTRVMLGYVS